MNELKAMKIMSIVNFIYDGGDGNPIADAMNAIGYIIQIGENLEAQKNALSFIRKYLDQVEDNLGNEDMIFADLIKDD